jgi:hypothetical protein
MKSERGSAIVYVFIGVALFGVLMFAFTRGGSQNSTNASSQQARIIATQIIDFSDIVSRKVNTLLSNGCSETEINFYVPTTQVANPLARADGSCDVFKGNGKYITLKSTNALISGSTPNWFLSAYIMGVSGVGSDTYIDMTVMARNIKKEVCVELNNILGIPNPSGVPPRSTSIWGGVDFVGVLYTGKGREINPAGHQLYGKDSACYISTWVDGKDYYYFYKVIVPH